MRQTCLIPTFVNNIILDKADRARPRPHGSRQPTTTHHFTGGPTLPTQRNATQPNSTKPNPKPRTLHPRSNTTQRNATQPTQPKATEPDPTRPDATQPNPTQKPTEHAHPQHTREKTYVDRQGEAKKRNANQISTMRQLLGRASLDFLTPHRHTPPNPSPPVVQLNQQNQARRNEYQMNLPPPPPSQGNNQKYKRTGLYNDSALLVLRSPCPETLIIFRREPCVFIPSVYGTRKSVVKICCRQSALTKNNKTNFNGIQACAEHKSRRATAAAAVAEVDFVVVESQDDAPPSKGYCLRCTRRRLTSSCNNAANIGDAKRGQAWSCWRHA